MAEDWQQRYQAKRMTLTEAICQIPRGKHIFIGSGAAEPVGLVQELVSQHSRFADNTILHLLVLGPAPYVEEEYRNQFRHDAFFIGSNVREAVHQGRADYTPVFLSRIPDLIRSRRAPVDVALIQVTPPDRYGYVNLGVSVDIVMAAVESAKLVIAEVNPNMPTIFGSGFIPMDRIDAWVYHPSSLPVVEPEPLDEVALEIGRHVASLVEDGSTLQVGIGQVPDAVLASLDDKQDLGVWTEMFSDGVIELMERGNITNRYKTIEPRVVSSSFTFGSARTYEFVDRNPAFSFRPSDYINNPVNIAKQHKMVAINAALQIDLTGQVCSDSIGTKFYSGIGGQVDFIRGASMCPGGKPIIALRSTAKRGTINRIVANLDQGAGVVTSRGDVRYVVTEYGIADLLGRTIRERALALVSIAHPDARTDLLGAAKQRRYVFPEQIEPRASYPVAYEKRVETKDGQPLLLRPIREVDEDRMRDLFYSFSEATKFQRWGTSVPAMSRKDVQRYLEVDDVHHVAIVVETTPPSQEPELIAVGRYHQNPADDFAEVALVIRDDWQGRGVGTALAEHLADIARRNGLAGLTAQVMADNAPMLHVFAKLGLQTQTRLDGRTYLLRMPFGDSEPAQSNQ